MVLIGEFKPILMEVILSRFHLHLHRRLSMVSLLTHHLLIVLQILKKYPWPKYLIHWLHFLELSSHVITLLILIQRSLFSLNLSKIFSSEMTRLFLIMDTSLLQNVLAGILKELSFTILRNHLLRWLLRYLLIQISTNLILLLISKFLHHHYPLSLQKLFYFFKPFLLFSCSSPSAFFVPSTALHLLDPCVSSEMVIADSTCPDFPSLNSSGHDLSSHDLCSCFFLIPPTNSELNFFISL